jgi:Fe2+ transport system protein FeoA
MRTDLAKLPLEKIGLIERFDLDDATEERLHKFGFIEGARVEFIKASPFADPRVYKVFNTFVALRNNIARKIQVKVSDG